MSSARTIPSGSPPRAFVTPRPLALALLAVGAVLAGCDAPHDNPLDPGATRPTVEGRVEGRATGIYPPFPARGGVRVRVLPLNAPVLAEHVVVTAPDGTFFVDDLPEGTYTVRVDEAAFRPAADTVAVTAGATAVAALQLDARPVVTAQAVRTVRIARWNFEPAFRLEVEATATDPDRDTDLDGADLVVEAIGLRLPLTETAPGRFAATLEAAQLPEGRVQSLLGQTLRIEAVDIGGNVGAGAPIALVRVIEQEPQTLRPALSEVLTVNPPTLEWRDASLPFEFTYSVEVAVLDPANLPTRVALVEGVAPTRLTQVLAAPLPAGTYVWTVWVVDAAGNRSQSKPAGFIVP